MIKVKRLEMVDIINAPYIDRLFYQFMGMFSGGFHMSEHLTINPLKWSLMTVISLVWFCLLWCLLFPLVGIPCVVHSAHKLKSIEYEGGNVGVYQSDVWLLRPLGSSR